MKTTLDIPLIGNKKGYLQRAIPSKQNNNINRLGQIHNDTIDTENINSNISPDGIASSSAPKNPQVQSTIPSYLMPTKSAKLKINKKIVSTQSHYGFKTSGKTDYSKNDTELYDTSLIEDSNKQQTINQNQVSKKSNFLKKNQGKNAATQSYETKTISKNNEFFSKPSSINDGAYQQPIINTRDLTTKNNSAPLKKVVRRTEKSTISQVHQIQYKQNLKIAVSKSRYAQGNLITKTQQKQNTLDSTLTENLDSDNNDLILGPSHQDIKQFSKNQSYYSEEYIDQDENQGILGNNTYDYRAKEDYQFFYKKEVDSDEEDYLTNAKTDSVINSAAQKAYNSHRLFSSLYGTTEKRQNSPVPSPIPNRKLSEITEEIRIRSSSEGKNSITKHSNEFSLKNYSKRDNGQHIRDSKSVPRPQSKQNFSVSSGRSAQNTYATQANINLINHKTSQEFQGNRLPIFSPLLDRLSENPQQNDSLLQLRKTPSFIGLQHTLESGEKHDSASSSDSSFDIDKDLMPQSAVIQDFEEEHDYFGELLKEKSDNEVNILPQAKILQIKKEENKLINATDLKNPRKETSYTDLGSKYEYNRVRTPIFDNQESSKILERIDLILKRIKSLLMSIRSKEENKKYSESSYKTKYFYKYLRIMK